MSVEHQRFQLGEGWTYETACLALHENNYTLRRLIETHDDESCKLRAIIADQANEIKRLEEIIRLPQSAPPAEDPAEIKSS